MRNRKTIQVFEHSFLPIDDILFKKEHFIALSKLNELYNYKYFDLRYNGVKFKQYVGVLQVDGLTIEILPKIDDIHIDDTSLWQRVLIDMLKVTKKLRVEKVGEAHIAKQQIHLLDIYFEWFLKEMQLLLYQGVIKQYYQHTKNTKVLKGKLEFARQLHRNLIHKERFYTTHQVYEKDHLIHQILGKALQIVEKCSKGTYLYSSCKSVQLDFPEVKAIKINQTTFRNIPNNRKTKPYETALKIARLILLNYAPDISSGKEKMLALLFDMNILWEEYVLVQLKKYCLEYRQDIVIIGQATKSFIDSNRLRPDIVIKCKEKTLIIDTKWKLPKNDVASTADMRQMYAYLRFWQAEKGILLYPGKNKDTQFEDFKNSEYDSSIHQCKIGFISVLDSDNRLDKEIGEKFLSLLGLI